MKTQITFTFDEKVSTVSKINALLDFITGCKDKDYILDVGTQLNDVLFDPSDNKGFYRVGTWSINTID